MRRRIVGLLLALTTVLAIGGVARADFHAACTPFTAGVANVALTQSGGNLSFSGTVTCPGASVTITSLALAQRIPPGATYSAPANSCSNSCSTSGTAPASPGVWRLRMTFGAVGNGFTFAGVVRCRVYTWTSGAPSEITQLQGANGSGCDRL